MQIELGMTILARDGSAQLLTKQVAYIDYESLRKEREMTTHAPNVAERTVERLTAAQEKMVEEARPFIQHTVTQELMT